MASARNAPPKKVLKKSFNVPAFFSILVAYAHEFTGKRPFEADFPITAYQYLLEDFIMSEITGRNVGKTCRTHYKGTFNDGTQFDSSYDRGEPLEFVCGAGQMIQGFDAAVADMEVGEVKEIHLMPEEAYGQTNPDAIFDVEIADLPGSEELQVGQHIYLQNQNGQHFPVTVTAKTETTITFDANHEMAGKELNFKIELVEVN